MRGARYGFPGWVAIEEIKHGTKRRYLEHRHEAQAKAVECLAGAKTAGEIAGFSRFVAGPIVRDPVGERHREDVARCAARPARLV